MNNKTARIDHCTFEILERPDGAFLGIGKIHFGKTQLRSGRLPMRVRTTSFSGFELYETRLSEIVESGNELRFRLQALFRPAETKLMRDHSFDPIHETGDWDSSEPAAVEELDLVIRPAADEFHGIPAQGFSYHYEYRGSCVELFYLLDQSSWELDGDITGATAVSQSSCSDPLGIFDNANTWSTEGLIFWEDIPNPVMTHNLPRWASHQAFDFQWKSGRVLLGVFERVDLIRTLVKRESGAAELKVFDKHIFDQAATFSTVPKKILLVEGVDSPTAMQNLWTWVFDEVHARARAEFGLQQEPTLPRVSVNYWKNWTLDSYYKDLLPAASGIGVRQVFIDNVNRSDYTEDVLFRNMCCGHDYEPAPLIGGEEKLKELVERFAVHGIQIMSWTNNDQAYLSPLNYSERDERQWFVKMEDTRTKYGGAYMNVMSILNFRNEEPRRHWIDCLKRTRETTGLGGYLFDSFYNLGFMPVNFAGGKPATMWRELLSAFRELQDAGVHFLIESFGPFGQPQHGCPKSYSIDRCWTCYEIGVGNDYTTVPTEKPVYFDPRSESPETLHYILAHKTVPPIHLFKDGERVDRRWNAQHRRVLTDYHEVLPSMKRRYLQEDGKSIIWHSANGKTAVLFLFENKTVVLTGTVRSVTDGEILPVADSYTLKGGHTYTVEAESLPSLF